MSSIIDALQREGAIVFWRDYRSGTLIDWSIPRGLPGTGTKIEWQGGGRMAFPVYDSNDITADQLKLQLTQGALIVIGDFPKGITGEYLISKRDAFGENYSLSKNATLINYRDSSGTTRTLAYSLSGQKHIAVNFKHGETPDGYIDGVFSGAFSGVIDAAVDDADLVIGNDYNGNNNTLNNLVCVMICNRKLTATEHARLYGELLNFQWPRLPHNIKRAELETYTADPNLAGAWDMVPVNAVITDASGSGNSASLNGAAVLEKDCFCDFIRCDGSSGYLNIGNTGISIKSICFWIKPTTTTEELAQFTIAGRSVRIIAGTLSLTGIGLGQLYYVNGSIGSTITAGKWQHIAITCTTATISDLLYIGRSFYGPNPYFDGCIGPVRIWSTTLTAARVLQEYKRGQSAGYCSDWGVNESIAAEAAEGQIGGNSPWYVSTGTHSLVNTEIAGRPVKAIECITDGIVWMKTCHTGQSIVDAAYGTWEWWQYKVAANFSRAVFSCGTAGWPGYYCDSVADDSYKLYRADGTLLIDGGALNANDWNHIKITRSNVGNFTLYVNDVLIGSAVDTTDIVSELMGFDIDTGDKICYSDLRGNHSFTKKVLM